MDEDAASDPGASDPSSDASRSIGAYLTAQRKLRGISTEELSRQTRIPLRSLERLEAGLFDADVDGFVRGFVRTVAQALGLDPDETLNRTLQEPVPDGRRRGAQRLSLQRVFLAVFAVALVCGVGLGVRMIAIQATGAVPEDSAVHVTIRRDPVRALAEAQGVAALSPAPALALASARAARGLEDRDEAVVRVERDPPPAAPASR